VEKEGGGGREGGEREGGRGARDDSGTWTHPGPVLSRNKMLTGGDKASRCGCDRYI
jgi:hypothetical protein